MLAKYLHCLSVHSVCQSKNTFDTTDFLSEQSNICLAYLMQVFLFKQDMSAGCHLPVEAVYVLHRPTAQSVSMQFQSTVFLVDVCSCILGAFGCF